MIDWDDAFDNSGYIPGSEHFAEKLSSAAASFRAEITQQDGLNSGICYGSHPREVMDLFYPNGRKVQDVVVFVHGGYWHMLDNSYWSHLARGALEHGRAVAIPSYPLTPQVRIQDITLSITRAIKEVSGLCSGAIRLVGHSAGGHLVSRMACVGVLETHIQQRIARVVSVSGIHDLRPLTQTKMNETLCLTPDEAESESPALRTPSGIPATFWIGADERPELLRQNRLIAETWHRKGVSVCSGYDAGQHHFSVIETLSNPESPLISALFR